MKQMVEFLARYGYWLLFVSVLGRQACLPIPANLLLLAAGALAGLGKLSFVNIVAVSVIAFLLADHAWYEAGRRWGGQNAALHLRIHPQSSCMREQDDRGVQSLWGQGSPVFQVRHWTGRRRRSHGGHRWN